jgi:Lipocalin-like domain
MSALWPLLGDKLFDSMVAYSGKFKLSGNAFTTTVDTSWVTEWLGTEQLRYLQFDGDTLAIRTATQQYPRFPGRLGFGTLRWQREH